MNSKPDRTAETIPAPASGQTPVCQPAEHDAVLKAAQAAVRDTTRLIRLFTILSEPAPLELMLDRALSALSELFAADIVVLVDPAGSGTFSPLAAIGLPEDMIQSPMFSSEDGCVAIAMATGAPIVKNKAGEDPSLEPLFQELGTETAVWLPVAGSRAARGVLILARCNPTPFAEADVDLLSAMAYRIGLALEQTQRSVQLEYIVQAGRMISRSLSESAVCAETVRMFPAVVGADAAALVMNDPSGRPTCVARFGVDVAWDDTWNRMTEQLLSDRRFAHTQSYNARDLRSAPETASIHFPDSLPVHALLAVPIRREERVQALLYAMRFSPAAFGPDSIQVAMLYVAQTSAALENARFYQAMQEELAERVRMERRLCESEERLQLALMGAELGMWDWNIVTGGVSFNDRWPRMLGYSLDEIEPHVMTREKLIHPDDFPKVMGVLQTHLEGRTPYYETEHRFLAKSGNWIWVLDKGKVTHRDAEGRPLRFVGTCLDITEAKQIQADRLLIEQQKQQAWRAESLSRMAGGIAHHFNNLLQAVMGNLELALSDLPQDVRSRPWLEESMRASARAAEVSQLMVAYLGQKAGRTEKLDLAESARAALSLLSSSMPNKIRLKADLPSNGPIIMADGVHIKQVLTNLVSNAMEAIGEGEGEISLAISMITPDELGRVKLHPLEWEPEPRDYICLSISDTGAGMDSTTQERIFEPFFTTKFTGRGMGMAVTLGIVRSFGGAIAVESELGRGAIFRLVFPAYEREVRSSQLRSISGSGELGGSAWVLVVDDDPVVRLLAEAQLTKLGYDVIQACDGVEAVEKFRSKMDEFGLVLLDLRMPRMDGWETLVALRAMRPDIPVVIASGYDEGQAMEHHHKERAQAFLHKPYKMEDLKLALGTARNALHAETRKEVHSL